MVAILLDCLELVVDLVASAAFVLILSAWFGA